MPIQCETCYSGNSGEHHVRVFGIVVDENVINSVTEFIASSKI